LFAKLAKKIKTTPVQQIEESKDALKDKIRQLELKLEKKPMRE